MNTSDNSGSLIKHQKTDSMELSPFLEAASLLPIQKFPNFYGTGRFIMMFTQAIQWYLSWTR
jgi:hypothetical protein